MITRTTTQLIADLRDPANGEVWREFDARYRPLLKRFAARLGFGRDDAEELAQQTLAEFCRAYRAGKYDRSRGRLRSWLIGIARHTGQALRRARGPRPVGGDTLLGELPEETELSDIWEQERAQAVLAAAMARLRESTRTDGNTIRAFELYALRGLPVEQVAADCALSVDAVYVIKNRLTRRLREFVAELEAAYAEEG